MIREIANPKSPVPSLESPVSISRFPRRGFTLVEVLVVVAIIGILAALLLPAVQKVQYKAKQTRIQLEMKQLMTAIEDVRTKLGGGQYPPDGTNPVDTVQFLKTAFPRCPATNYPTQLTANYTTGSVFNPSVALVFWLGGAQDSTGAFIGFSANPQNPFDASASRLATSFDLQRAGTTANPNPRMLNPSGGTLTGGGVPSSGVTWNLYQYYPQNGQVAGVGAPYLYFKAVAGQYYTTTAYTIPSVSPTQTTLPYADSSTIPGGSTTPQGYMSPKTYQLLCPGMDGKYGMYSGTGLANCPVYPAGTNYDQKNGADDMTSFTNGMTVGDDAQ